MKPSERIYKIYSEKRSREDAAHATLMAICEYLDEEWEKNACNRGEHKWILEGQHLEACEKCSVVRSV